MTLYRKFLVEGGTYSDTTFTKLVTNPEMYFFKTYEEARNKWWELTSANVDICENRWFIREIPDYRMGWNGN